VKNRIFAAPMAGITDKPFRTLCLQMGAGLAVSEMMLSNPDVWHTKKSSLRLLYPEQEHIRAVQLLGNDPAAMASIAVKLVNEGVQLIDINMGCPAKKVNKKIAGSALLAYPALVKEILSSVVTAVNVPVTLKIRTGIDLTQIN